MTVLIVDRDPSSHTVIADIGSLLLQRTGEANGNRLLISAGKQKRSGEHA